jgi:beta-lactamase superfamily II metal-dependent hydrolase
MKKIILTAILLILILFNHKVYGREYKWEVHFLDIGQSDCILIKGEEKNYLIDTGLPERSSKVLEYLRKQNINNIEAIIITHYHDDHYGGLKAIIQGKKVNRVILPSHQGKFRELTFSFLKDEKVIVDYASKDLNIKAEGIELKVLMPIHEDMEIENNNSLAFVGTIDGIKYGFLADVEKERERELLDVLELKNCDILKVPHHGLETSTTESLLNHINPRAIIVTCDGKESPDKNVFERLLSSGGAVFRTDIQGNIIVKGVENNKIIEISTDKVIE